ncbi:MAG: ABC transporter ATP-binding protein/permease [Candidatus Gastranaerophilales bacterium]|nr:ABC transporter ATP-binding protein/permease [Candidatus Gastranaerophilales bacterium]MCM1072626.1 ABC transporter ATP-binding protein/permease [Bacteroides sp.]
MKRDLHGKFFKYFIDDKKSFIKYFALSFVVGVLELFGVALTYPFINQLLSTNGMKKESVFLGILIISAFIIKNIFMIFYNYLQAEFTKNCEMNLTKKFMNYFVNGDYSAISNIKFAKKNHILFFLIPNAVNNYLIRVLNLIVNIFVFSLIISFLFIKFFYATIITLICSIVLLTAQTIFLKYKTKIISSKLSKAGEEQSQAVNTPLLNIKSIKILNAEKFFFNNFSEKAKELNRYSKGMLFYNSIPAFITEPFIIILLLILLSIISIQNISNSTELVACYALVISAIFRLAPTISRIQINLTGIQTALPQVKELIGYYEEYNLDKFKQTDTDFKEFNNSIELKNITFAYDNKLVLNNINLTINKGEFIGIAGSSGAGKTTLVDIIAGLLKIRTGELYLDKQFIKDTRMPKLRIGYIPQDYSIISASIRENVAFGIDNIDDNKVIDALKKACLYDFISQNYPEGIYANPFVDNTGFSQGQKQRLAIARALYTNPDIIILDEATSSLDLKTEDEICAILNNLKGEKTIIAIAHRLSTIKNANRIIFMKNSTINDTGSFEELLNRNTFFQELVQLNNTNLVH